MKDDVPQKTPDLIVRDHWERLRPLTPARIALGRTGSSLPTREVLAFSLAHSRARDAVEQSLDIDRLRQDLTALDQDIVVVASQAEDRSRYLVRPDLGRRLNSSDAASLVATGKPDLVFILSDGLSATALQNHAAPVLRALWPRIPSYSRAPLVIATQARVALADEVGQRLNARLAISLIGERPGLSAPDSLGIYVTYAPRAGNTDDMRNCISNIRPEALSYAAAAQRLGRLIDIALAARCTGIKLQAAGLLSSSSDPDVPSADVVR